MSARKQANVSAHITIVCIGLFLLSTPPGRAATRTWTGASEDNALASTAANWDTAVPEAGDSVLFNDSHAGNPQTNAVWDLDIELLNWTQTADYDGTVTIMTEFPDYTDGTGFKNLSITGDVVLNGGSWTHEGHPVDCDEERYRLAVTVGNDFTLGSEASVNVDWKGYPYEQGPGCGLGRSGAGYGGHGAPYGSPGAAYGSPWEPVNLGSGGGHDASYPSGGSGGGAVLLDVSGTIIVNGTITAHGEKGSSRSGGGSGGSIWLLAGKIEGDGAITADGGDAPSTTYRANGGGGRIALDTAVNDFTGVIRAKGGTIGDRHANHGTFNFQPDENRDLIIEHDIALPPGTNWVFKSLLVTSGITFEIQSDPGTEPENYEDAIPSRLRFIEDVIIEEEGALSADGLGHLATTGIGSGSYRAGAGYGGFGGVGGGGMSGITYGSVEEPHHLGSGGGEDQGRGSHGGGALILDIGGKLSVNGTLSANGSSGGGRCGGGSGGSIWIQADAIEGDGTISADGGDISYWAGGGGGRIALYPMTNDFTGVIRAQGKEGSQSPGRSGTFNFYPDETKDLVIEHDIALAPGTNWVFRSLRIASGARFEIQAVPGTLEEDYEDEIPSRLRILGDLTIEEDAVLSAEGLGYFTVAKTTGDGPGYSTGNNTGCSGAGYGGAGGQGYAGIPGIAYGDPEKADCLGSSGAADTTTTTGGAGGGALLLDVGGTLTVNGHLSANAGNAASRGGGGSGGSIRAIAQSIEGIGLISADGGTQATSDRGAGGGGGRILLIFGHVEDIDARPDAGTITTDPPERLEFAGDITVTGGTGLNDGEEGTIRYRLRPPPQGTIFTFY